MFKALPPISAGLVRIEPIEVATTEAFRAAKHALAELLHETEPLRKEITSESDLRDAQAVVQNLKRYRGEIIDVMGSAKQEIKRATDSVTDYEQSLLVVCSGIQASLSAEVMRYQQNRERARQEAEQRANTRIDAQRKSEEWSKAVLILRGEIASARQVADNSERSGESATAVEIRKGLQRFNALDSSPNSFTDPLKHSKAVRQLVATALQNEQQRNVC